MWHVWETGAVHTGFMVGRPEGKRRHGRPRRSWEDSIKTDLQEVGWGVMDSNDLAQGQVAGLL